MTFHSRVDLVTGSALALMTAAIGDHAQAEGKLDASYTISFARCSPILLRLPSSALAWPAVTPMRPQQ